VEIFDVDIKITLSIAPCGIPKRIIRKKEPSI
jgi:hypothetical protein